MDYTLDGTESSESLNTSQLYRENRHFNSFRINGHGGNDVLQLFINNHSGFHVADGGSGDDAMTGYANTTDLPIVAEMIFIGGTGSDNVFFPSMEITDMQRGKSPSSTLVTAINIYNGTELTATVHDDVESICYTDSSGNTFFYLTEDLARGRTREVDWDELVARTFDHNADWFLNSLDTYSDYHSADSPKDVDGDGFVDEVTNYQMWTASGGVDLRNRRGRTYSDDTSRKWDVVKAVEQDGGFSVLVEGQQNKEGKFKVVSADDEGVIDGATRWLNANQMLNEGYEDLFATDFNGINQIDF